MPNATVATENVTTEEHKVILAAVFNCDALRRRKPESVTVTESFTVSRQGNLMESVMRLAWEESDDLEWDSGISTLRLFADPEICS